MAEKKTEKKESKVLSEIKAFITLVFIVGLISVGGWYWYTHFYSPNHNKENNKEVASSYKINRIAAESGHTLKVLNDKYIYEIDEDSYDLFKVMDLDGNTIFTGKEKYTEFFLGVDGNFYFVKEEMADAENIISLFKIEDKKAVLVKKMTEERVYFSPVIYHDGKYDELLGYAGSKMNYDDGEYELEKTYYYNLKGEEKTSEEFVFNSEETLNAVEVPFTSNNSKYFLITNASGKKYGLLNIDNFEVVIEPSYEGLYTNFDNKTFVAVKDKKAGIVDENQKKIVDFEYDYIDRHEDFYVVGKNNKMAIMDNNFELVTDFEFDYQSPEGYIIDYNYKICCTNFNTFTAVKVGDKYVLTINAQEGREGVKYNKRLTYVIKSDGTYDSINANIFKVSDDLIYSYLNGKKEYVIYDKSLTPKFSIDASKYDYSYVPDLVRFGNTLAFKDKKIYFDYETGEEVEEPRDYEYSFDNIRVQYGHGKVNLIINDKVEHSYEYKAFGDFEFIRQITNGIYHLNDKEIVILKK